ncbi:MAG: amidohydrolase family protein [Planctomycetales bacterium]|nr:amidohydrolase family protein [Planctomycetales bacterium]
MGGSADGVGGQNAGRHPCRRTDCHPGCGCLRRSGEALRSITLSPAEILGVADRVGSLTAGKEATLIVTTGDPLETATRVTAAYIQGRQVDLNDRHKRLWKKYEEKYKRLGQ